MRYFFALLLPPVAVLLCNKPGSFVLNCFLTFCGYVPGIIHALFIVQDKIAEERQQVLIKSWNKK